MITLKVKKLSETAHLPEKAHEDDGGFDIYADMPTSTLYGTCEAGVVEIPPHCTAKIPTGIATEIPHGYYAAIHARSGMATKRNLRPAQGVSIIDAGYRGEWIVPLHNDGTTTQYVRHGERIAQFTILPVPVVNLLEADELNETSRGNGGFGSTGTL